MAQADGMDTVDLITPNYHLEIDKSERTLRVQLGLDVHREFQIASGSGGHGTKQQLGDKRTPEGIYRIVGFNDNSKFHLFMRLNYPNVKDAYNGFKNKLISRNEFDRIVNALHFGNLPPQNTALGGAIGIHGVGIENSKKLKIHTNMDWTNGCIALTNAEISELRRYVSRGTEVVIVE
jgi:murein L,D-transpeptidase YafK